MSNSADVATPAVAAAKPEGLPAPERSRNHPAVTPTQPHRRPAVDSCCCGHVAVITPFPAAPRRGPQICWACARTGNFRFKVAVGGTYVSCQSPSSTVTDSHIIRFRREGGGEDHKEAESIPSQSIIPANRSRPGSSVKQFEEFSRRYSSLPQDGAQSASLDGAVLGDDHSPAIRMPVDGVTAFRAHVDKAKRLDNTGDLADR